MAEKLKSILKIIETLAPKHYAMKWDNVGLQIGSENDDIEKVMICLDITEEVLEEAINHDVNLIIAHHPMIFSPLKSVSKEDVKGKLVYKVIQHNINIYAAHTNVDIAPEGLNDFVANRIGLKNIEVLDIIEREKLYKVVVFVPEEYEEKVADALAQGGAGHIGNYSHCSFRSSGMGTFKPLEGTNPFIGEKGKIEKVQETRLETIVALNDLNKVVSTMLQAHPYEEVAYDIIPLENSGEKRGIGRVGDLEASKILNEIVVDIKSIFNTKRIRVVGDLQHKIKKIAIVNGSGADYIELAKNKGCDCLITGDVKYHDAQTALELGIAVIDAGHFETEIFFADLIADYLQREFKNKKMNIEIMKSHTKINPFKIL
ncbi:dinuclear metal center protein, YbgI/SA1388 family [Anaerovirgula multivorans]|uniref:GTP cyclohydrolase 1 type 2 homolog n=1 Tax=Anaerovirgula multivorans TaxID=312168 RepID=A0A239D1K9_9FIRM|nr:Nif3-like dinuclear metal center hexameric protein [Anaerovirgula multivorans]SNS26032.1 dinuclear metal center protein, YbgI/SA1388 family [Anaerovirgula multivorans]